jgi:cystathionine gamma-synthase
MGQDCVSPARHSAFSTPLEMMGFIAQLRELSGGKPVGFKLCLGKPEEFAALVRAMLATGVVPDFVTVDGAEGGTGAAPPEFSNSVGMPLAEGLTLAHSLLIGAGLRDRVRVVAAGKVLTGFSLVRTLAMGADAVMHSATKYMGGHSDLLAGVAVARTVALANELRHARELCGGTPGTLEMFLALRGLRTMSLRVAASQANAVTIAKKLMQHPQVHSVRYPGLPSHPAHALASTFMRGFSGVVTFEVHGDAARADAVCQSLKIIRHATSLGAVESTIERRAAVPGQGHLPAGLLRMSVGCEDVEDLWRDLEQAMSKARR